LGKVLIVLGVVLAIGVLLTDIMAAPAPSALSSHGHGGQEVAPIHSPISLAFALLGPPIVLGGLMLTYRGSLRYVQGIGLVAGLTLLYADGLLHWLAVLEHLSEPLSAGFFVISGAIQVGAIPLARRREKLLWWVGVALTLVFIELYIITRIIPPPFLLEPESVESLGTFSKGVEIALLAALGLFFRSRIIPMGLRRAVVHRPSIALLFLGVLASLITSNLESYQYWWVVSTRAFVLNDFLLIGLIAFAGLAYYLRTWILVGMTWSFAAMVIIVHVIFAISYASDALVFPILLCIISAGLLSASMFTYGGMFGGKYLRRKFLNLGKLFVQESKI